MYNALLVYMMRCMTYYLINYSFDIAASEKYFFYILVYMGVKTKLLIHSNTTCANTQLHNLYICTHSYIYKYIYVCILFI